MKMESLYTTDMAVVPFTCEDCNTVFMNRDAYAMHVMIRAKEKSCRSESRVVVTGSTVGNGRTDIDSNIGNSVDVKSSSLGLHSTTAKETLSFVDQGDMSISEIENCIKEVKQEVMSNDGSNAESPVPLTPKLVVVKTEPETNNRDCSLMESMNSNSVGGGVISRRTVAASDNQNVSCTDTSIVKEQSPSLMNSSTNLISSHHVICLMCDSQFADQDSLAMHMMSYHAESASSSRSQHAYHESTNDCSHPSSIQHYEFPSHTLYQSSRRGTARLRCDECGAAFENEDFLTLHLISHRRGVQALHNTAMFNDPSRIYSQMLENKRKRQLQHGNDLGENLCSLPMKKNSLHAEPRLPDSYHSMSFDKHSKSSSLKAYLSKYNTIYKSHGFQNESVGGEKMTAVQKQTNTSSNNSSLQEKQRCWKEDQLRYMSSIGAKGVNRSQSVPNDFSSENSITSRPHSVGFIEKSDYQSKQPAFLKNTHYCDTLYDRNVFTKNSSNNNNNNNNKESQRKHGKFFDQHQENMYRGGRNIGEGSSSKDRAFLFYDSWSKEKRTDNKTNCTTGMSSKSAIHNSGAIPVSDLESSSQQGKQEQFVSSSNGSETTTFSSNYSDILHELKNKAEQVAMCKHCDVIFLNRILYHLHMGLHNVNNPWQCNICGKVCNDVHNFTTHAIHF